MRYIVCPRINPNPERPPSQGLFSGDILGRADIRPKRTIAARSIRLYAKIRAARIVHPSKRIRKPPLSDFSL